MATFKNVDEYIQTFPPSTQEILQNIRRLIHEAAPQATEAISYNIPVFNQDGRYLVYFSGWKQHVSLYPIPDGDAEFQKLIKTYESGKGTLKFPLNKPIPYEVIKKVAQQHVAYLTRPH